MKRSVFLVAAAMATTVLLLPAGPGGDHAGLARRHHRHGTAASAAASARVSGTGGHVSVLVSCHPGGNAGPSDGSSSSVSCRG
jgi:hypothetical protein